MPKYRTSLFFALVIGGVLPVLGGEGSIYERAIKGEYEVSSGLSVNVVGNGMVDLLLCVPYPVSNLYQDIVWTKPVESEMISSYPETGEPYIRYAVNAKGQGMVGVDRSFMARLYTVKVDFSKIRQIYGYDVGSVVYQRYTRQPDADSNGNLWVDTRHEWIARNVALMRDAGLNALELARAAYALVATNFSYSTGWKNTISEIVNSRSGDCGQLSSVFVSLLRAAGIPARCVVCMRPNPNALYHVWAEFYLERYGWIPTDVDYEVENRTLFHRFGVYDDTCIVMSLDTHLSFTTAAGREVSACLVQNYAYWWWWYGETTRLEGPYFSLQGNKGYIRKNAFVPETWLVKYYGGSTPLITFVDADTDRDGMLAWEEYVAGTIPVDRDSRLVATITVDSMGKPSVDFQPKISDSKEAARRRYRKWGKVDLRDEGWTEILSGQESDFHFFNVSVEMK